MSLVVRNDGSDTVWFSGGESLAKAYEIPERSEFQGRGFKGDQAAVLYRKSPARLVR